MTVFNVSDDKKQKTLAQIATLQIPSSHAGAAHLAARHGWPDLVGDWRAPKSRAQDHRFATRPQDKIAVGQSTQPLQMIGRNLYVGRQLPLGQAVHLTQADGESMESNWKTVVGARLLAANQGTDGQLVCVSEGADTFLLSANEVSTGVSVLAVSNNSSCRKTRSNHCRLLLWRTVASRFGQTGPKANCGSSARVLCHRQRSLCLNRWNAHRCDSRGECCCRSLAV